MQINHPAYLISVERSGIGKNGVFCGDYVNEVRTLSNKLPVYMVKMAIGVDISSQLSPGPLNCIEKFEKTVSGVVVLFVVLIGPLHSAPHWSGSEAEWST